MKYLSWVMTKLLPRLAGLMEMNIKALLYFPALLLLTSACSTHIPPEISQAIENAPSINEVRTQPENYLTQRVRWGGVILKTENKADASYITVIAFPLDSSGRPELSDQSSGRFIAKANGFLEPQLYSPEREITVSGTLLTTETINIGEYPYEHPVVQLDQHYLWAVREAIDYYDYPPYWYDPWYYPYYPYYPRYYPVHPHRHK